MKVSKEIFKNNYERYNGDLVKLSKIFNLPISKVVEYTKIYYSNNKPINIDKELLEELYITKKLSVINISKELGISRDSVYKYLKKHNLSRDSKYDIDLIRDLYANKNYNINQLLTATNLKNRQALFNILNKFNIVNPIKESINELYSNYNSEEEIAKKLNITVEEVKYNLKHHSIYRSKIVNIPVEELKKLRYTKSLKEIAEHFKCSERTICHYIDLYKLPSYKNLKYIDFPYEEIYDLYITKNYTLDEIATKYNCSRRTVGKFILANKIVKSNRESSLERRIREWLDSNNIEYIKNDRRLIAPFEVDFYLFEYDIAIELCGVYWHSTKNNPDKNHILKKHNLCKSEGVRLITIYEDEINNKFSIVLNRLASILQLNKTSIYARKCVVKEISSREGIDFLEKHHIQGAGRNKIYLGAFYNNDLVSVMSFSSLNPAKGGISKEGYFELNRFANPNNVVGVASKLFKYYINRYNPIYILSYADLRWNTGDLYLKLGFKYIRTSAPNYWYINRNERVHRWNYTKRKILDLLDLAESELTEEELAESIGLYKIYDCGNLVYEWKNENS